MKSTLRKQLADSHIAAVAVVVLLLWALLFVFDAFNAVFEIIIEAIGFLITAIAIRGIPYYSPGFNWHDRVQLIVSLEFFAYSLIDFLAALVLSIWAYKEGPIRMMNRYWRVLNGRNLA